jgi:hypothetical protein
MANIDIHTNPVITQSRCSKPAAGPNPKNWLNAMPVSRNKINMKIPVEME